MSRDFTSDLGSLLLNISPSITAPKGHKARKIVADAFYEYFTQNGPENASTLVRSRYENSVSHMIPTPDIARFEIGGAIAILVNTAPSIFWMVYSIYSEPELLRDCRKELEAILTTSKSLEGEIRHVIDMTAVKTHCRLLTSIFTETLRWRGIGLGVRQVLQDAVLDNGKYLLKKGSTVMMPARVLHSDPDLWGADVQDFQPRRFLKDSTTKHDPVAFRGFGGGTTLCPGRHFATTGILATVAMMILRYDINACDG